VDVKHDEMLTALPERFERHNRTELGDANYNDGATKSCKKSESKAGREGSLVLSVDGNEVKVLFRFEGRAASTELRTTTQTAAGAIPQTPLLNLASPQPCVQNSFLR
jgi:hypothetical protein